MTLDWIHDERITRASSSSIAEAAATEALPPEPLGAAISEQQKQQHKFQHQQQVMATLQEKPENIELMGEGSEKSSDEKASLSSTEKDSNGSNPVSGEMEGSGGGQDRLGSDEAEMIDCSTSTAVTPTTTNSNSAVSSSDSQKKSEDMKPGGVPARAVEAIHSAMMAHPASIFVELDDTNFSGTPFATAPPQSGSEGGVSVVGCDSPEMVLDEVARRLFICLLAGLKTCASHVSTFFFVMWYWVSLLSESI